MEISRFSIGLVLRRTATRNVFSLTQSCHSCFTPVISDFLCLLFELWWATYVGRIFSHNTIFLMCKEQKLICLGCMGRIDAESLESERQVK